MGTIKKHNANFPINAGKQGYFVFVLFFILCFVYINWYGRTILYFQEKQSLFIYTGNYLKEFLLKPGGLLEYAGRFLTQFYYYPLAGALILSSTISLPIILCIRISKKTTGFAFIPFLIIPAVLLFLMQGHYYHLMEYNLGFLLVLSFFNTAISPKRNTNKYLIILLIPAFYYLSGAYLFFFLGIYVIHNLVFENGKFRFTFSILAIIISLLTFLVFHKKLFLQPVEQYFLYPLPLIDVKNHKILLLILTGFLPAFPLLLKLSTRVKPIKNSERISYLTVAGIFAVTIFLPMQLYNPQTFRVLKLEHLVSEKKYNEAIRFHEKYPSQNLIGQYLYNISLSETGQLCERLFYGSQDFTVNALILPWSNEHLPWGARFFYSVGLVNEAHRWAYEEMVVYGKRPQNIELLLKANIINGNYERAKKYNNILKATLNYKNLAKGYENILEDTTQISQYPGLISMRNISPKNNFFIQVNNPQNNIPLLLQSNPNNKKAFEYEMAWLLLSKDVETIVTNLGTLKELGYSHIPQHLEEAVLIYYNGTRKMPALGGLSIRQETISNFEQYVTAFKNSRNNLALAKQNLGKDFGNTFMYYFHFR